VKNRHYQNTGILVSLGKGNTMTTTQNDKGLRFRELHKGPGALLIANAWDAGSARILMGLGYQAIATSSGASACTLGRRDGNLVRDEALALARAIAAAVDLPVSADLENGFAKEPESVAETIRLAAEAGLVGASIEDATGEKDQPLYDAGLALERVAAAVDAAKAIRFPFTLTARTENFVRGNPDLRDTIKRLQAFDRAGADVLFAPGLPDLASVRAVCSEVSKPVNFMVGLKGKSFSVVELEAAGIRRISFATSLYRAAMSSLLAAAREIKEHGTFSYTDRLPMMPDLYDIMKA
jgi:2-methylisocitrate lyase-like PEP mutase family enzyme